MKKLNLYLIILLFSLNIVSCDKDDNESTGNNNLIGIWKHTFRKDPIGVTFKIFHNDGTLEEIEIDEKEGCNYIEDIETATYTYYPSTKQIFVNWDDEEMYDYTVKTFTETNLTVIDPDGYTDQYVKYNGTIDDIAEEYECILYYDTDEYEEENKLFESPLTEWGSSKYTIKNKMSKKGYTLLEEETNKLIYKSKYHEDLYAYKFDNSGLCEAVIDLDASLYTKDNILEHLDDTEEGIWLYSKYNPNWGYIFYTKDIETTLMYRIEDGWHTLTYTP